MAEVEKILLPQMAHRCADAGGNVEVIVDDEADAGGVGNGQNPQRQGPNLLGSGLFGSKLDEVGATLAKLPGDLLG